MLASRKKFLQQAGLALAGTCLSPKLFSKDLFTVKNVLDTYHPVDNSVNLATSYKYLYNTTSSLSDIAVLDGFYSFPYNDGVNPPNTINPFSDDVMYAGESSLDAVGAVCSTTTRCINVDIENKNPFRYKAYYPKDTIHDYVAKPLPVYIFFHAGGFQECSNYELKLITNLCIELSQKGWVCFTVEYRRGRIEDPDPVGKFAVQQQFARYRAIQDGCGAIRTIIKKNRNGDAQRFPFTFNENQVFIGGTSAGGIIALGCTYYQTSADLITSQNIDQVHVKETGSAYNIKQTLGKMHANYYYAPPDPQYWPVIKGVASLWGGFFIPKTYDGAQNETDCASVEATFFQSSNTTANPPLICFHGALDPVIPFYDNTTQDVNLSDNPGFKSEDYCTNSNHEFIQKVDPGENVVELKICSSLNLYLVMRQLNRFTEFYLDCSMGHGLDDECGCGGDLNKKKKKGSDTCIPCVYTSNFGTSATNQLGTTIYMAARIAVFSYDIMASSSALTFGARGRSFFKDCENFRANGQTTNNNACTGSGTNTMCNGTSVCTGSNIE